jgi:hypothetical protein
MTPDLAGAAQAKTHVGGAASSLVTLAATGFPGSDIAFDILTPEGTHSDFVLPEGTVLVVTDVVVRPVNPASSGRVRGAIQAPGGTISSIVYDFDTTQAKAQHLDLTGGAVFSTAPEVAAESGSVTPLVFLYGYLAKDK